MACPSLTNVDQTRDDAAGLTRRVPVPRRCYSSSLWCQSDAPLVLFLFVFRPLSRSLFLFHAQRPKRDQQGALRRHAGKWGWAERPKLPTTDEGHTHTSAAWSSPIALRHSPRLRCAALRCTEPRQQDSAASDGRIGAKWA